MEETPISVIVTNWFQTYKDPQYTGLKTGNGFWDLCNVHESQIQK